MVDDTGEDQMCEFCGSLESHHPVILTSEDGDDISCKGVYTIDRRHGGLDDV